LNFLSYIGPLIKGMSVVANVACTTVAESKAPTHTITLLLPGLKEKKIIQFNYTPGQNPSGGYEEINENYIVPSPQFKQAVCNAGGVVPRRAEIYIQTPTTSDSKETEFIELRGEKIYPGNTIILLVRKTTVEGENDYYNIQQDALRKNNFPGNIINKHNAIRLLCYIARNFEWVGWKVAVLISSEIKEWVSPYYPPDENDPSPPTTRPTETPKPNEPTSPTPGPTHQYSGPKKCWTCWWK